VALRDCDIHLRSHVVIPQSETSKLKAWKTIHDYATGIASHFSNSFKIDFAWHLSVVHRSTGYTQEREVLQIIEREISSISRVQQNCDKREIASAEAACPHIVIYDPYPKEITILWKTEIENILNKLRISVVSFLSNPSLSTLTNYTAALEHGDKFRGIIQNIIMVADDEIGHIVRKVA
jgi:hypothetical protein